MKRLLVVAFLFSLVLVSVGFAGNLGLFISDKNIYAYGEQEVYTYSGTPLNAGLGFFYTDDDGNSWLLNPYLVATDLYQQKPLNLGVGFQAILGEVEPHNVGYDIFALGFLFTGSFDFTKTASKWPVYFESRLFYAPDILSFADGESILSLDIGAYYNVTTTASVGLCFKIMDVNIDKPDTSWDESALMVGAKIRF
ncbi:hypothetical protein [Thermodesulfatator atlanticus]|uniref:hypothetical protein n=1 Tax=Thermodesulfatator atlanticus TaxID=501497 RepID=UPI0003B78BA8|nr:hypothetical protein [Thermodesulfatator atlanticus]